jgi:hypothetical protein
LFCHSEMELIEDDFKFQIRVRIRRPFNIQENKPDGNVAIPIPPEAAQILLGKEKENRKGKERKKNSRPKKEKNVPVFCPRLL